MVMTKCLVIPLLSFFCFFMPAKAEQTSELFGEVGQVTIPIFALGLSLYNHDEEGLWQLGKAAVSNEVATDILKYNIDAPRPDGGGRGFPSGHSSRAFMGATFIYVRYGWEYGLPANIFAAATAWSRVDSGHHNWADVAAGAVLGIGISYFFSTPLSNNIVVYPLVADKSYFGVGLTYFY
jgi:membrane-associated phospholipid phosphatase